MMMNNDAMIGALDRGLDQLYEGMQQVDLAQIQRGGPEDVAIGRTATQLAALFAATRAALTRNEEGRPIAGPKDKPGLTLYSHMQQAITIVTDAAEAAPDDDLQMMAILTNMLRTIEAMVESLATRLEARADDPAPWFQDIPSWTGNGNAG